VVGSPDRLAPPLIDKEPKLINPILENRKQTDAEFKANLGASCAPRPPSCVMWSLLTVFCAAVIPKLAGTKPYGAEAVMGATSEEPALILGSNQCCNKPPLCPQPCPGQADDFSASAYLPAPVAIPRGCCGQPGCPGPEPCPIMGASLCCEAGCPQPLPAACSKVQYGREYVHAAARTRGSCVNETCRGAQLGSRGVPHARDGVGAR
jgi:hypothetical protein